MTRSDHLARRISWTLADPGHEAHAVARLNSADHSFSQLDSLLRSGAEPPAAWVVTPRTDAPAHIYVTALYDLVSEMLRTEWDNSESAEALYVAAVNWERLTRALRGGAPLPQPWERD